MKKLILVTSMLVTAFSASARPGHGGSSQGAGTPNNSFGQTTAGQARAHTLSGKEQAAAAKTRATDKQQSKQAEKNPAPSPSPSSPTTPPAGQ